MSLSAIGAELVAVPSCVMVNAYERRTRECRRAVDSSILTVDRFRELASGLTEAKDIRLHSPGEDRWSLLRSGNRILSP